MNIIPKIPQDTTMSENLLTLTIDG
ncbi:MAG: ferredoxin, partial [Neisseria sp.]